MESKLPKGWKINKVGDISKSIQYGFTGKTVNKSDYRYLRITDIQDNNVDWNSVPFVDLEKGEAAKYLLKKGDVVFARTGATAGKSFLIDDISINSVFASYLIRVVCDEKIIRPDFLYAFFQSPEYWIHIASNVEGAAQPNFNGKKLSEIPISYPESLTEQQRIVAKIDRIFERLDKSIALVEENIGRAKALKASILSKSFHEGEELPEGWEVEKVDNLTSSIGSGFACNKNNEVENGYVHLRTHNIDISGKLNFDLLIKIHPDKVDGSKSKLKKGDVLFNNTNSKELVGKTAIVDNDYNFGYSNHLTLIKTNTSILPEYFVYYFVYLHKIGYFENICNKWIGQAGINNTMLSVVKVTFPEIIEIQQRIVAQLDRLFSRIDLIIAEQDNKLQELKAMKASVLDKAFRGEM